MTGLTEDTVLIRQALAYVNALYRELSRENGAATPGTQNQAVGFILADPALRAAVAAWARSAATGEEPNAPPQVLPRDAAYAHIRAYLAATLAAPGAALPFSAAPRAADDGPG